MSAITEVTSQRERITLRQRIRRARSVAQPSGLTNGTDYPYRMVSIVLSMALARFGVSPNAITVAWSLLGFAAACALAAPELWVRVIAGALLEVSYLLDFADGEVARLLRKQSKKGMFLDLIGHTVIKAAVFLAVGYQTYKAGLGDVYLVLGFSASVFVVNAHLAPLFAEFTGLRQEPGQRKFTATLRRVGPVRALVSCTAFLMESPGLYGSVLLATVLGQPGWLLWCYGIVAPCWLLLRVARYSGE